MNLSFPSGDFGMEHGTDGDYSYYHEYFFEHLEIEILYKNYPYDKELLDSIVALIVEKMCIRDRPAVYVLAGGIALLAEQVNVHISQLLVLQSKEQISHSSVGAGIALSLSLIHI